MKNTNLNLELLIILPLKKQQKFYVVYPGGCFSNSGGGGEDIPSLDEIEAALNQMTVATSGKLGLKGASVNLYSLNFEGGEMTVLYDLYFSHNQLSVTLYGDQQV